MDNRHFHKWNKMSFWKLHCNKGRKQLVFNAYYVNSALSWPISGVYSTLEAYMKHTDPIPPHPQLPYSSSCPPLGNIFYSWVTPCHRESNLANLHYFRLLDMANVLRQQNVGHIIQGSNNLQLRCQNLKVGTSVMRTAAKVWKGIPVLNPALLLFWGQRSSRAVA